MLGIGTSEFILIAVVALIVVGPKDLPVLFRTLGRFTAQARSMAREFSRAMEDAADQAGVKDVTNTLKSAADPRKMGLDKLNAAADRFEKWDPARKPPASGAKPAVTPAPKATDDAAINDAPAKPAGPIPQDYAEGPSASPAMPRPAYRPAPKPAADTPEAAPLEPADADVAAPSPALSAERPTE